jgi:cytoskeletal protein CcmA (bactofilin family)
MELKTIHLKRLLLAFPLVLALLITTTFTVSAKPLYYGETVPAGTIVDSDVFLAGNEIVIDGMVVGDVFAIGNHILINGTIEGSLVAIAQTVRITGKVRGTAYAAAIAIELGTGANLNRNLYYGGLSFTMRKGSLVQRDLAAFSLGGTMTGQITGNVKAVIGPYEILKLIFDALKINFQLPGMIYNETGQLDVTPGVPPSAQSTTSGDIPYSLLPNLGLKVLQTHTSPATTNPPVHMAALHARQPNIARSTETQSGSGIDWQLVGNWFLGRLRSLIVLAALALVALLTMPGIVTQASSKVREKPMASLGTGLIGTIISFNAILAALLVASIFTALGFWLLIASVWELGIFVWSSGFCLVMLFILLVCFFVFYVTKAIIAYALGSLILKRFAMKTTWMKVLVLMTGLVVYVLLAGLPYIGWVISILATGFGFGSAWLNYRQRRALEKPSAQVDNMMPSVKPVRVPISKSRKTNKSA